MKKTNDSYCVVFQGKRTTERYYRDRAGWLKVSTRGRVCLMTAEQVLNHVLPALAFSESLGLRVTVEQYERHWKRWLALAPAEPCLRYAPNTAGCAGKAPAPCGAHVRGTCRWTLPFMMSVGSGLGLRFATHAQ
jgi:hypothetical protein